MAPLYDIRPFKFIRGGVTTRGHLMRQLLRFKRTVKSGTFSFVQGGSSNSWQFLGNGWGRGQDRDTGGLYLGDLIGGPRDSTKNVDHSLHMLQGS